MGLGWWKGVRRGGASAAIVVAVATPLACSPNPVRVGLVLPLTGTMAPYGRSLDRGARLAEKHINATGGIEGRRLTLVGADSGSSPGRAAAALGRLIAEERIVAAVGGANAEECAAIVPVADRAGLVVLSPSAPSYRGAFQEKRAIHNWPALEAEGEALSEFAAYTLHASKALVLAASDSGARSFAEALSGQFRAQDRECRVLPLPGAISGAVPDDLRVALGQCQICIIAGTPDGTLRTAGALKSFHLEALILAASAFATMDTLRDPRIEGVIFARPALDEAGDFGAREFAALYGAEYGEEGDTFAAHAYDAVILLAQTIARTGARAGVRPGDGGAGDEGLRKGLLAVRDFPGASGVLSFGADGRAVQPYQICVVKAGRALPLKSVVGEVLPKLQQRVEARRFGR